MALRIHERWWALTNVKLASCAQDDVKETVNKAFDAQLEAEASLERAAKANRIVNVIRQSNHELFERSRKLERLVLGFGQAGAQPYPMSLARRDNAERAIDWRDPAFGI